MRVLLATDGSTNSLHGAELLARWKHKEPLKVDVLSVANLAVNQVPVEFSFGTEFDDGVRLRAQMAAQSTSDILRAAGLNVEQHVVDGHPAATIVEKATELQADLIVIGALGHSLLSRLLLGSVSDYVASHANCSVLVVRETSFLADTRPVRVCVGFDDSGPSKNAIDQLAKSGWASNAHVDVVSVVSLPIYGFNELTSQIDPQEVMAAYQLLVDKATDSIKQTVCANATGHVLRGNNVGLSIADFVEREKSDLVVVGDTGLGLVARFILGSASRSVLRYAPCSVWLVRGNPTNCE